MMTTILRSAVLLGLSAMATLLTAIHAEAQVEGTRAPVPHNQILSANPFGLLFEWFNADYERKVGERGTLGVAGSLISFDGGSEDYYSVSVLYRFYPQEAALSGFYFGPKAGYYHVDDAHDQANAFGFGFELGYNWLLGSRRDFAISMGVGATRLFGGDLENDSVTVPTLRLVNIGWAF